MKSINKYLFQIICAGLLTLAPNISQALELDQRESTETVSISLNKLKIVQFNQWRNATVKLEYDVGFQENIIDIQSIRDHIKIFLLSYPNDTDYWEIINKKLIYSMAEQFPEIAKMKITFSLAPDLQLKVPRESIIEFDREAEFLKESFNFTKLNHLFSQESFESLDIKVQWAYTSNVASSAYLDYRAVNKVMQEFFNEHPLTSENWKLLKPQLQEYFLNLFPSLVAIDLNIAVVN